MSREKFSYMKYTLIFLSVFLTQAMCANEPLSSPIPITIEEKELEIFEDEIETLNQLIATNEKRLATQKMLKLSMETLKKQKDEFFLGNQSKSHAYAMVSNARLILSVIKQEHLSYLFSPEYLEELVFFSSIAGKSAPVRP